MGIVLGKRRQQTVRANATTARPCSRESGQPDVVQEEHGVLLVEELEPGAGESVDTKESECGNSLSAVESSNDELSDDDDTSHDDQPVQFRMSDRRRMESSSQSGIDEEENEDEHSASERSKGDSSDVEEGERKDESEGNGQQSSGATIEKTLEGNMDMNIPEMIKIVRIFTSSTFTDTSVERNTLMERVYPRLKSYCQERGFDFQVVDMRWGVRDEATDDHMTSELCMRELRACQKLSTGPNFITFLGQKYGYRPFPPKISATEFEKLLNAVKNENDQSLLTRWFRRDDNCVPSHFLLQPITSLLPHYRDHENPKLRKKASDEWWAAFERMQIVLREAADQALTKSDRHRFFMSVTEDEIRRGIITAPSPGAHCCWFKREIVDLRENLGSPNASKFMDKTWGQNGAADESAQHLLRSLRDDELPRALPNNKILKYSVRWTENGIDPKSSVEHAQYVDALCTSFYDTLSGMIAEGISGNVEGTARDHLVEEVLQHAAFCRKKCEAFHGREAFIQNVREALFGNDERRCVVLYGTSGCGKTSLMAKVATQAKSWLTGGRATLVLRFVGTSPDASHVRLLLRSICLQLYRVVGENIKDVPEDTKSLITLFPECLETAASSSRPVVVILDSLDQISTDDGGQQLDWLPTKLPDHVYMILSTLPEQSYRVFPKLKAMLPSSCLKEVPAITLNDANIILDNWLRSAKRELTAEQTQTVLNAFQKCPLPLYLKLAFDESCRWKSYTPSTETALAPTVRDLIRVLFERVERLQGRTLVSHALAYITASKNGLTEPELEDLLSLDDEVLNDVYQYWTPPVRRLPPLLWIRIRAEIGDYLTDRGADDVRVMSWYHRQFVEVARERYLPAGQTTKIHKNMSEYFLGTWSDGVKKPYVNKEGKEVFMDRLVTKQPLLFDTTVDKSTFNLRKLNELPYHLLKSRQIKCLKSDAVCNFEFVLAKVRATSLEAVLDDLAAATDAFPDDQDFPELEKALQLSAVALRTESRQLGTQLLSRLFSHLMEDGEHAAIRKMLQHVYHSSVPCLIPSRKCLTAPGGALVSSMAVSQDGLHCAAFSCDSKTGYVGTTTSNGFQIDVINIRSGKHLRKLIINEPTEMSSTWAMHASEVNAKLLMLTGSHKIFLLDTDSGQVVQDFKALQEDGRYPPMPPVAFADRESRLVAITDKDLRVWTVSDGKLVYSIDVGKVNKDEQYGTLDALGNLAVYSIGGSKNFKVLDVKTGKQTLEVQAHKSEDKRFVQELKFVAGNKVAVLSSDLTTLRLYDVNAGGFIREISTFSINKGLHRLQLTADRKTMLSVANFEVMITDLETGDVRKTLKSKSFGSFVVHTGLFCRDGRYAFSFGHDNILRIYDLKRALEEETQEEYSQGTKAVASVETINTMHSGPDGRHVLCSSTTKTGLELSVWDTSTTTKVRSLRIGGMPPTTLRMCSPTRAVGYIHDTSFLHFKVYDLESGKVERCLHGKASKRAEAFGFINEKHMVSFSQGRRNLKVWDIDSGKVVERHTFGQKHPLEDILISKDGSVVVCAQVSHMVERKEKTLPLIVLMTGSQEHRQLEMTGQQLLLTWSSISDDGRHLLNLTRDLVPVLWDLQSGKVKHKLRAKEDPATYATAISTARKLALTAHSDGDVRAWEVDSGHLLYTFSCETVDLILVSADGQVAYSRYRYRNSSIEAWSLTDGTKLATFTSDWKPEKVTVTGNRPVLVQAESPELITLRLHAPGCDEVTYTGKSPYEGVATEGELEPCSDSPVADEGDHDPDEDADETDVQINERTTKAKYARPNVIIGSNVVMSKKVFQDNFEKHL